MISPEPPTGLQPDPIVPGLNVYSRRVARAHYSLIAVHGGLDRATSFSRLVRRLEGVSVFAYDRRGYQGSRDRGPGTLSQHVDDLEAVAAAIPGPIIVLGHSFGGLVAMASAASKSALFRGVVCYESPVPWVLSRPPELHPATDDPAREAERFFRRVVSDDSWQRLSKFEQQSRHLDGPALLADLAGLTTAIAHFDVADIAVDTTYAYGDGPAQEYYEKLAQLLRKANRKIQLQRCEHSPHGIHLAHPQALTEVIRQLALHIGVIEEM